VVSMMSDNLYGFVRCLNCGKFLYRTKSKVIPGDRVDTDVLVINLFGFTKTQKLKEIDRSKVQCGCGSKNIKLVTRIWNPNSAT
jgi:hypothetical protein